MLSNKPTEQCFKILWRFSPHTLKVTNHLKNLDMKKLLVLALSFCFILTTQAQVKFGIRGGISTSQVEPNDLLILGATDAKELKLAVNDSNYSTHFGLFTQIKIKKFFIQPEVLFNSNSVDYTVTDFRNANVVDLVKNEKFQNLDIPLMLGFKFGALRLQGGPVGHVFLNSTSELFDIEGYSQKFDDMTFGYQAGIGLDLWKFVLDVKYEGNFNKEGDHIVFGGNQYNFDQNPGRLLVSVGFAF